MPPAQPRWTMSGPRHSYSHSENARLLMMGSRFDVPESTSAE